MNIIKSGDIYKIYNDGIKVLFNLEPNFYNIKFNIDEGFFLTKANNIIISEKIYGQHQVKVNKVLNSFKNIDRNLGIILSGAKGIGKSLFAKMIANKCIEQNIPVIFVDSYHPGIANFINSLTQEICFIFDEFDKTFSDDNNKRESLSDPQTEMLTLFDGISTGKKMFIITCNELRKINSYLVNRPGRFHYHFRFDYPDNKAIEEYLLNKNVSKEEINKVKAFSSRVPLNYDCLRSIAFELKLGYSFQEAIKDLNILNVENIYYKIYAYFDNDFVIKSEEYNIDFFNEQRQYYNIYFTTLEKNLYDLGSLLIDIKNAYFNPKTGFYSIDKARWALDDELLDACDKNDPNAIKIVKEWKDKKFKKAVFKPFTNNNLTYSV